MSRYDRAIGRLLDQIDEAERRHDAAEISDEELADRTDRYTAEAAALLRASQRQVRPQRRAGPSRLHIIGGAALLACAVAIGLLLRPALRSVSAAEADPTATSTIQPIDREAMLQDAFLAAEQGDVVGAAERYSALLATDPEDALALTYYGWMLSRAAASDGDLDVLSADGVAYLDRAVVADPELPEARWFRAVVRAASGDVAGARADLDAFLALDPAAGSDQVVQALRAQLGRAAEAG